MQWLTAEGVSGTGTSGEECGEGHPAGAKAFRRVAHSTLVNTLTSLSSCLLGSDPLSLAGDQRGRESVDAFH